MDDVFIAFMVCPMPLAVVLGAILLWRYIAYKEAVKMIEMGMPPPSAARVNPIPPAPKAAPPPSPGYLPPPPERQASTKLLAAGLVLLVPPELQRRRKA